MCCFHFPLTPKWRKDNALKYHKKINSVPDVLYPNIKIKREQEIFLQLGISKLCFLRAQYWRGRVSRPRGFTFDPFVSFCLDKSVGRSGSPLERYFWITCGCQEMRCFGQLLFSKYRSLCNIYVFCINKFTFQYESMYVFYINLEIKTP